MRSDESRGAADLILQWDSQAGIFDKSVVLGSAKRLRGLCRLRRQSGFDGAGGEALEVGAYAEGEEGHVSWGGQQEWYNVTGKGLFHTMTQGLPVQSNNRKKKIPADFPARTREHHIADLSLNHIERLVLLEGWTVEGKRHDYGYDLVLNTYDYKGDPNYGWGELESGEVLIQLKATDRLTVILDGSDISFRISTKHIRLWQREIMPVILIVYDVANDKAYWLYTQQYFNAPAFRMPTGKGINLRIPKGNVVDAIAIRQFRNYKEEALQKVERTVTLHV